MAIRTKAIILLLSAWLLPGGCSSIEKAIDSNRPTARLLNVKFDQADIDSADLLFDVEVKNNYPVALPLTDFEYNLSSKNAQLVSGSAVSGASIPANGKRVIPLAAQVNYLRLFDSIETIKPGSTIPYQANVTLSFDTPAFGMRKLPLKKEGEIALPDITKSGIEQLWKTLRPE